MKLINISNHPSKGWSDKQKKGLDEIIDIQFPIVPSNATRDDIISIRDNIISKIRKIIPNFKASGCTDWGPTHAFTDEWKVSIQGSFILVDALNQILWGSLVFPISNRNTVINQDGTKTVKFVFEKWIDGI
jgi:hypothetical protein